MNQSESSTPGDRFAQILQFQTPAALAWIRGNTPYAPGLSGMVRFFIDTPYGGVLIEGEFFRLPYSQNLPKNPKGDIRLTTQLITHLSNTKT